ncbi:MAG: hypothetical protein ACI8WB_004133 [Phenylobacterium sp.]|jgi:hypothetical protein
MLMIDLAQQNPILPIYILLLMIWLWIHSPKKPKRAFIPMRKTSVLLAPKPYQRSLAKNRKKTQWVTNEVLRLKVLSGVGCGKVAETFNRIHGHRETVSKSFVYEKLKQNQYQLLVISRHCSACLDFASEQGIFARKIGAYSHM